MNKFYILLLILFLCMALSPLCPLDFWQYPEAAERDSIFAGGFAASFAYSFANLGEYAFSFYYPVVFLDYVLPLGLPFSFGLAMKALDAEAFGLGIRPAYHINFNIRSLDVYVMYPVMLNFLSDRMILEYSGGAGFRFFVLDFLSINVESGYAFKSVNFGIALKLN
jgi:hypothetical protein